MSVACWSKSTTETPGTSAASRIRSVNAFK